MAVLRRLVTGDQTLQILQDNIQAVVDQIAPSDTILTAPPIPTATIAATASTLFSAATTGSYLAMPKSSISLQGGQTWTIEASFWISTDGASPIGLYGLSGLYAANGDNTATVPAPLASSQLSGDVNYDGNLCAVGNNIIQYPGSGYNSATPPLKVIFSPSVTTTVFAVPKIFNLGSPGASVVRAFISAVAQ